jgi:ubiquinone/menaquinone biosynthesis C-methylase UbiE
MGVATHLGIDLADYDARIRTFIPDYDVMLDEAAATLPRTVRTIVDLGTGTGALAARCLTRVPRARIVAIDEDADILEAARRRLRGRASFLVGSFLRVPLPPCDSVVASFALHHVRTRAAKASLYRRIRKALTRHGTFISVDCNPASDRTLARDQRDAWSAHLRRAYGSREAENLLAAWGKEDVYVSLDDERELLERAGLKSEVVWRKGAFAVIAAVSASGRR